MFPIPSGVQSIVIRAFKDTHILNSPMYGRLSIFYVHTRDRFSFRDICVYDFSLNLKMYWFRISLRGNQFKIDWGCLGGKYKSLNEKYTHQSINLFYIYTFGGEAVFVRFAESGR